ncbi:MAG: AraC family transcriptional regulator [Eubacteriales bacterium]|nr:AraC family transcriptional regulator [Eubacteriales bacterium]
MDVVQNMRLFEEQITCGLAVYTWQYDAAMNLLHTNCPRAALLDEAFGLLGGKQTALEYAPRAERPVIISTGIGLLWAADCDKTQGELRSIYVIGPFFSTDVTILGVENIFRRYKENPAAAQAIHSATLREITELINEIPVLLHSLLVQYALMLHYCVTGQKLMTTDVVYPNAQTLFTESDPVPKEAGALLRTEQRLLDLVRTGSLHYRKEFQNAAMISSGMRLDGVDSLRMAKISVTVFASLCARAAIEGGLLPEAAHTLGNACIVSVEKSRTVSEVAACAFAMYSDFVERVHRCRADANLSPQIRSVCDYIELNVEKPLTTRELADRFGYADYYLTRKFRSETGVTLSEYIQRARIEEARRLLATTDCGIQTISERLQFSTRSYFGVVFRRYTGMAPAEYREKERMI